MGAALWLSVSAQPTSAYGADLYDGWDGITCDYFNYGARIKWRHRLGDWKDAAGISQGMHPIAQFPVLASDTNNVVRTDVTALVRGWLGGKYPNDGILIAGLPQGGNGSALFHSREAIDPRQRPVLLLQLRGAKPHRIAPLADTTVDCATFYSIGQQPILTADGDHNVVLQFDMSPFVGKQLAKANLEFTVARTFGDRILGAFRVDAPVAERVPETPSQPGLAARYSRDRGIAKDSDVIMAAGFETAAWLPQWSYLNSQNTAVRVDRAPNLGFVALEGSALQVTIRAGQNLGLDLGYRFAEKLGAEPEEIYFRYYLRLASDWLPTTDGGKLPGVSATYGQSGWGGRKADGTSGWSMRGSFYRLPENGNPYHELTPIGTYAYHADMTDSFGDAWAWSTNGDALLERNRWYCIEQYFRVNQLGRNDGILRAWIDGRLVYENSEIRVRDVRSIKIEQVWMNVWYGGTTPSPQDQHLFIDNVVIARRYIGPMGQ